MAAVATMPVQRFGTFSTSSLAVPVGDPQGAEGSKLEERILRTESGWRDRSEYVSRLHEATIPARQRAPNSSALPVGLAFASVAFAVFGILAPDWRVLAYPVAGIGGLATYASAARWLSRQARVSRNRLVKALERVRRGLAYEG